MPNRTQDADSHMHPTGARNTYKANEFAETAKSYGMLTPAQAKRLTVVPVDLEDEGTVAAAIGNAGRVRLTRGGALRLHCLLFLCRHAGSRRDARPEWRLLQTLVPTGC